MGIYGTRDGKFIAKKLQVEDKVPVGYEIPYFRGVSSTGILTGWDVQTGTLTAKTNVDFSVQPPYPARLTVNAVVAGTAGGTDYLKFLGYDAKGNLIAESVLVSSVAGTSAAATKTTSNAFAKLTSITPNNALHASTDVNVGWDSQVGLPYPLAAQSDLLSVQKGLNFATALPTVDTTYDVVDLTTLAVGSSAKLLWMSKFQD